MLNIGGMKLYYFYSLSVLRYFFSFNMDSLNDQWLTHIVDDGLTELINKRMNLGYY